MSKLKEKDLQECTPKENNQGVLALILAPTRELALQVHKNLQDVAKVFSVRVGCKCSTYSNISDDLTVCQGKSKSVMPFSK